MKPYRVNMLHSLEGETFTRWNNEVDEITQSATFLTTTQQTHPELKHRFFEVYLGREIVARFYGQIIPFHGEKLKPFLPAEGSKTLRQIMGCALDKIEWTIFSLGNTFLTGDSGQYLHKNFDRKDLTAVIQLVVSKVYEEDAVSASLLTDLYKEDASTLKPLQKNGFKPFYVEPDLVLPLQPTWTTFDDYLNAMSSKYRRRAKRSITESRHLTIEDLSASQIEAHCHSLYTLYRNVIEGADFHLAESTKHYLFHMKRALPNRFFVRYYRLAGEPVGFISYILNGSTLEAHLVGLNYKYNREHHVYRRILLDCVQLGIDNRCETVHLGRTAGGIKTSYGAQAVAVQAMLKHHSVIRNFSIAPFFKFLKPKGFTVRHPFKEEIAVV